MNLHDSGMLLSDSQSQLTPIQRFVYVMAKDYWTPEDAKTKPKPPGGSNTDLPAGYEKGKNVTKHW